jgi:curved DNA-binding protein CbpA
MVLSYYEVLGIARSPSPTPDEVKAAYRKVAALYHPDRPDGLTNVALMAEASEAKNTLLDLGKRQLYDQYLDGEGAPRGQSPTPPPNYSPSEPAPTGTAGHRANPKGWVEDDFTSLPPRPRKKRSGKLLTVAILINVFSYYAWAHSVPGLPVVHIGDVFLLLVVVWGLFWFTPKHIADSGYNFVRSTILRRGT